MRAATIGGIGLRVGYSHRSKAEFSSLRFSTSKRRSSAKTCRETLEERLELHPVLGSKFRFKVALTNTTNRSTEPIFFAPSSRSNTWMGVSEPFLLPAAENRYPKNPLVFGTKIVV